MVVKSKQFGGKKRKNAANGLDSKKGGKKHHEPTNKRKKPKIEMDDSAQEDDSDEEDDFPEADEDMSDSEDEETGGNVHKPPAQLEIASDEEDFEDEEKGVPKAKVTLKMVSGWTCDLRTKQADELFRVAKEAVDAFLASVESASGKTEANLPKKKRKKGKDGKAAVDDKKNLPRSKYFIQGDNVFNAVVQMCLLDLLPAVNRYLKVSMKAPNDPKEKDACKSKIRQLTTAKNWKRMSGLLRSYSKAVFRLLDSLGDSDALVAVLKHVHQLAPYFLACERVSLTKAFLRSLVRLWSSSSSDPARLLAFMCILRIVRHDAGGMLDWTMKVMYKNYVRHCKFAQNPESAKWINFMKRTMTELYGLDEALAYRHGFVYVRQLAIHLRNATTLKTKNAKDTVLNWQYLHSLDFWGHAVGTLASSDVMSSLIYPLTQVAIGTIAVTDSPKFYPMRFHCVRILVELGRRTGTYIPTLPYALDILNRLSARLSKKAGTAGSVTFEFDRLVKVPASQVTHRAFLDACFEGLYGLLMESVHSVCHSVAFPEIVFPAANQIRMALKKVKVINFTRRLKVLLDKINDNVKFVEEARSKQKMSLTDQTTIKAVETQLQQSGKSPFGNFFRGWKAEQDKRNALLHAEEINIDTLKNANAKRMEAREKAQQEKMEKQKKADRRQLKGLFVNNSDEEEEVEEKPKKKKKKKPVKEEPAEEEPPKKKQKPEVPSAPYVDKGDIVEELDVDAFEESSEEEEEEEEEEVVEKPKVKAKKPKPGKNQKKGKKVKLEDSDDSGSDLDEDDVEFDSDEDDDDDDEDGEEDDDGSGSEVDDSDEDLEEEMEGEDESDSS